MSLQNLANQMQTTGRGGDSMLVHMNPKEVAGLQQLAMAHGGSLTINPETGLPEAGFLSSILPTVLGMALAPATGGASLGLTSAFQTAALVGAGTGLMTGSLKKGLMAGLGAFGGASMAPGIMGASSAAPAAAASNTAFVPGQAFNQAGTASLVTPTVPNAGFAQGFAPGQAFNQAGTIRGVGAGASTAGNTAFVPGQAFNQAGNIQQAAVNTAGQGGAPSVLNQFGSGLKNIITNQGGAGSDFLKDNKMNLLSSAASALMTPEEEEEKKKQEVMALERYAPQYTRYAPSVRPAGSTAERTYFAADGGMVPGPQESGTVEQMSQMNAVGGNTRYPMASQTTPTYAMPAERPISQNVIYPATDAAVGSYTGMAGGGIASLTSFKKGGPAAPKSEAQINEENAAKEYAAFAKERAADKARAKAESDKRTAELKKEYTDRISGFNKDTSNELKQKQKDIAGEKDREAKARMQRELKEWQSGRASELKGIQTDQNNAFKDVTNEYTNRVKDLDTEIRERQALRNFETDVFKKGYTGFSSDIKGDDLSALNKGYDTEIGKQKSEADKAKAALDAAKKTGIQSLIDRAQDMYNTQQGEFEEANKAKEGRINQFREETKRATSGIASRGEYTTKTGDVDAIKQQIADIKKNPANTGAMGATSLSSEQTKQIKDLESKLAGMSAAGKTYNPATGQYETKEEKKFQALTKAPTYDTKTKKIMEEDDVRQMFEEVAGRSPTQSEMTKYLGKSMTEDALAKGVSSLAELGIAQKFTDSDLNAQAKYYWGRDMTKGELAYFKDPANKVTNFNALRTTMVNNPAYLQNLNKINQASFSKAQSAAQVAAEGPVTQEQVSSIYQDLFGKPPTADQLQAALGSGASLSQLKAQLKTTPDYTTKMTQPLVPELKQTAPTAPPVTPISQAQIDAYRQAYNAPTPQAAPQAGLAPLFAGTGQGGYTFNQPQQQASIEGALPYQDIINRLGIGGVYQQIADKAPPLQGGVQFNVPQGYTPIGQTARPMADGGYAGGGYHLGDYSDGGRLLKGPGDGVSDSIPASIGNRQPARLADGEFVIPARIVSELGNGSTEAGARQLYAMMDRVQKKRRSTVGKDKVAVNSKANQVLPA
jgi:hypothetical protein